MKYYSTLLKNFYNSEEDCLSAEEAYQKELALKEAKKKEASEIRRQRATEVEQARDEYLKARKHYNDILTKFCNDYGAFHCSIKDTKTLNDCLESFLF